MRARRSGTVGLAVGAVALLLVAAPWSGGDGRPDPSSIARGAGGPAATPMAPEERDDPAPGAPDEPHAHGVPDHGVLRAWIPGGFDPTVLAVAAALPDVVSVTLARSATVGLTGTRDAGGGILESHRDGWQVPVAVTVVEAPATNGRDRGFDPAPIEPFGPGEVVLTESGASLRGIGIGGEIDLVGRPGLRVAAIVDDDRLPRSEIGIHPGDADALDMPPVGSITVVHDARGGTAIRALAVALAGLAPDGAEARVMVVSAGAGLATPVVLSLPERKAAFGEFAYRDRPGVREIDIDPAFVDASIVDVEVPRLGSVRCHRAIVDDLRAALEELVAAGLADWIDPRRYGGCFHARHIRVERSRLSTHAWGAAIDINVDFSMPGLGPRPPDEMIEIFGRHGFRWGGDFRTPDHHHWEWIGPGAIERPDR